MSKGLGWGEGFSWTGDIFTGLPEDIEPGAVFPLRDLDAALVLQHHGPRDAPVCGLRQSDGNPTFDVSARLIVRLPPLCCKATGYTC